MPEQGPRPPHPSQARGEPLDGATPDRITISGLTGHGRHGVYPFEREQGQTFRVDAVLELDTAPAAAGDELGLTVNYAELSRRLHDLVTGEPVDLIETLAQRLADADGAVRPAEQRDAATLATTVLAAEAGAWGVRVHDAGASADAVRTVAAVQAARREGSTRG